MLKANKIMSKSLPILLFLFFVVGCKTQTHTYNLTVKVAPEYQQDIKGIAEILTKRLNHFEQQAGVADINTEKAEINFTLTTQDTIQPKILQRLCTMSGNLMFLQVDNRWLDSLMGQSIFGSNIIAISRDTTSSNTRNEVNTLLQTHPILNQKANLSWQESNGAKTYYQLYVLPKIGERLSLNHQNIIKAAVYAADNKPELRIDLDASATQAFADLSQRSVNQYIAFIADDQLLVCPYLAQPITEGRISMSGDFSLALLQAYAAVFSSPSLPRKAVVSIKLK
jgi:preprotein translocase subunit SecD